MQQITADYCSGSEEEKVGPSVRETSLSSSSSSSSSSSAFFAPRTPAELSKRVVKTTTKPSAAVRGGVKKAFKHIEIPSSDDNSSDEVEYLPPKNFAEDSDYSSTDESDRSDEESEKEGDKLKKIEKNLPKESVLSRKRKVRKSKGAYGRKSTKTATNTRAKSPIDRVREYPDQLLSVVNGKLCCRACSMQELSLKVSSIKNHIRGESHKRNLDRRDKSQLTLLSYKKLVEVNESEEYAAGATLALNINAYRMSVTHALLKSGTPFTILDNGSEIRDLLEDGHAKCPKQACSDLIPLLYKKEYTEIVKELNEVNSFSISSDGTINVAEALAVVRTHFPLLFSPSISLHDDSLHDTVGCTLRRQEENNPAKSIGDKFPRGALDRKFSCGANHQTSFDFSTSRSNEA